MIIHLPIHMHLRSINKSMEFTEIILIMDKYNFIFLLFFNSSYSNDGGYMGNNLQYGVSQGGSSYGSQSMYNSNPVGQSSQGFDMSDYRYTSPSKTFLIFV